MNEKYYSLSQLMKIARDEGNQWTGPMERISVDELKRLPPADVRPLVRGHIITEAEAIEMGDYSRAETCSVCGHCDWDCTEGRYFSFCPNCGAKLEAKA